MGGSLPAGAAAGESAEGRSGRHPVAQLPELGGVRTGGAGAGTGGGAALHQRPAGEHRLHPRGCRYPHPAVPGRPALAGIERHLSPPRQRADPAFHRTGVRNPRHAPEDLRRLATGRSRARGKTDDRTRGSGHHRLYLRHDRQSQGGDALPRQHSLERLRRGQL